jgi:4-amino-4-deoxy-L-arabinose transferase-like glycosyltransferase
MVASKNMNRSRLSGIFANTRTTLALCSGLTLFAAFIPFVRACFRAQVLTNEGWNVYNAIAVVNHQPLYPHQYGWTTNNYPALSFFLLAWLHRFTHDYLFTGRAVSLLSLLAISALAGTIVFRLSRSRPAALLAALFCIAIFCANANNYVGADEPQMLAQVFVMAGFCLFLATGANAWSLVAAALLFTIGGSVKHNLIDFPFAVLIATLLQSVRRALLFTLSGIAFAALAVWLNIRFGGPHFLDELFLPRSYSGYKLVAQCGIFLGPILLPLVVASRMARSLLSDPRQRVVALQFAIALLLGIYFSGGAGVSINAFFSLLIGMSIVLGLLFARLLAEEPDPASRWTSRRTSRWTMRSKFASHPITLFAWLIIPLLISGNWNIPRTLRETRARQQRFQQDVALLSSLPGPVLCESPLLCAIAGKPFLYDAFNSTRLIKLGKLDQQPMLDALRQHRIAAVEMDGSPNEPIRHDRFSPQMLDTILQNYTPVSQNADATLYLPRGVSTPGPAH